MPFSRLLTRDAQLGLIRRWIPPMRTSFFCHVMSTDFCAEDGGLDTSYVNQMTSVPCYILFHSSIIDVIIDRD